MIEHPGKEFQGKNQIGIPSAAVAMILKKSSKNNDLEALVVKRKAIEHDPWSGHIALPGGRAHSGDTNSLLTARREVFEETSIDLGSCEVMGTLDEVVPGNVMIRVTPFVALAPDPVQVRLNESELTEYFWIPLSFFRDRRNLSMYAIERFGKKAEVPSYLYLGKHVIWGMTLKIIEDFLAKTSP